MFGLSGADQLQFFEKFQVFMFVHYYFYLQIKLFISIIWFWIERFNSVFFV